MATAIELTQMPTDDVLRQLLGESTNLAAQEIVGCSDATILTARKRLDASPPWDDRTPTFRLAAGVVVRHRWRDYPERIPAPMERHALVRLIEHEMSRATRVHDSKPTAPTMTPGEALIHLRRFEQEHHRWPTVGELAAFTDRTESQIRDKVARVIRNGQAEWEGHMVRVIEGEGVGEVTTEKWCPICVERHLRRINVDTAIRPRVQSQRIQAHFASLAERGESTVMNNPASAVREAERAANNDSIRAPVMVDPDPPPIPEPEPESPPNTEPESLPEPIPEPVHEPTPTEGAEMARQYSRNDNVQWPEDAEFIHIVEAEYSTARGAAERLAERFTCSTDTVQYRINLVFSRMNRKRPHQEAGRERIHNWGTDEEFTTTVERVYQENPWSPCDTLAKIYGAPSKQVSSHISRTYKRLGRPRPMAVAGRKAKVEVAAATVPGQPAPGDPESSVAPETDHPKLEVAPMAINPGNNDANQPQKSGEAEPSLTLRKVLNALMVVEMPEESLKAVLRQLVA